MNEAILINPRIPPAPYTLADAGFVSTLEAYERQIADLKIVDDASNQLAAMIQIRLTEAGKALEKKRLELIRPALDWQELIQATAKPVKTRIDSAKLALSNALVVYSDKQIAAAKKAEAERLEELARLERVRQVEAFAAKKKSDELAAAVAKAETDRLAAMSAQQLADAEELTFVEDETPIPEDLPPPEKTETEQKIEALKFAPVVVAAKPQSIKYVTELRIQSVDVSKLPEVFIRREALEGKIRQAFCVGWTEAAPLPVVPGVVFEVHRYAASTGGSKF